MVINSVIINVILCFCINMLLVTYILFKSERKNPNLHDETITDL